MNRREFLRVGVAAGVAVGLPGVLRSSEPQTSRYAAELTTMIDAAQPYLQQDPVAQNLLTKEQVASKDNPRLQQKLGEAAAHALVIVHPGYFPEHILKTFNTYNKLKDAQDADMAYRGHADIAHIDKYFREDIGIMTDLARGKEGDYGAYWQNLSNVFSYARQHPQLPLVTYRESSSLYASKELHKELQVPGHGITVASIADDPQPQRHVWYRDDDGNVTKTEQDEALVFDWLAANKVNKVLVAGEYGVSRGGGLYGACAGTVAIKLQQRGFDVAGIRGSVFPTAPIDLHNPQVYYSAPASEQQMADALYNHTVSLQP